MHTICCVYLMNPKVQSLYNDVFFLSVEKETVEKLWKKEAVEFLETGKTQCVYIYIQYCSFKKAIQLSSGFYRPLKAFN